MPYLWAFFNICICKPTILKKFKKVTKPYKCRLFHFKKSFEKDGLQI